MLACDDIMPTGWTPAAASSTLEKWTRTLAESSNVVVLELPYSTEFWRESRKFVTCIRKYRKCSHFLTHHVVYGGQGKEQI